MTAPDEIIDEEGIMRSAMPLSGQFAAELPFL
jgi:hypothetical protein